MTKKNLSRSTLKAISDAWNTGQLGVRNTTYKRSTRKTILIYNNTNSTFHVGDPVWMAGFPQGLSYVNAHSRTMNNTIVINADSVNGTESAEQVAICDEDIAPGCIGKAYADVVYTEVYFADSGTTYHFANSLMQAAVNPATFRIIAKSEASTSNSTLRWCALARVSSIASGGGQGTLMTKTVATGLVASVSNGYCTLSVTGTTIKYYGEP